jgi:CheY-like chemotaxis protein
VLVVDDEVVLTGLLARALGRDGCDVTTVMNGGAALSALEGARFDLVLCDLMMPEMSGQEVYREATRKWPQLARRFAFMTGGAFTPRGRQFLSSVPAPILEKPFGIDDLLRFVHARLRLAYDEGPQHLT